MTNETPPKSFMIIAIAAVVWNILGLISFVTQVTMSPEAMAALPQEQQDLYAASPGWMNIVFGIATVAGFLGSVGLAMKKMWAVPLFLLSLLGVAIQMGYSNLMTDAPKVFGMGAVIMSILVIVIAAYLLHYSRQARTKGWLH
ncbi:MAG: hypothetical protein KTR24_15325 [Saprospiraceae bacterium]|nr:hypothetical protein [Saprospiraceae bacterium]